MRKGRKEKESGGERPVCPFQRTAGKGKERVEVDRACLLKRLFVPAYRLHSEIAATGPLAGQGTDCASHQTTDQHNA